jgi:hypothetical protein
VFYLCPHCDRGQRYCSSRCREKSRRLQRREANRRYEQSLGPEGRLDHCQRQREYRQRLKARVTDQSSLRSSPCVNLTVRPSPALVEAPAVVEFRPSSREAIRAGGVVCQICGRWGRWINPFPEVKYDCR